MLVDVVPDTEDVLLTVVPCAVAEEFEYPRNQLRMSTVPFVPSQIFQYEGSADRLPANITISPVNASAADAASHNFSALVPKLLIKAVPVTVCVWLCPVVLERFRVCPGAVVLVPLDA